jgi:signal peptidase II
MKKRYVVFFIFLLFLDLISKYYVSNFIPKMGLSKLTYPYGGIPVFKNFLNGIDFSIVNVENFGAAWGIFSSYSDYLLCARIFIILGLVIYLFFNKLKRGIILLIITGASGNILDFFIYGHVVDMFYFKFWGFSYPIFNVADSLITIGIVCLFSFSVQKKSQKYA